MGMMPYDAVLRQAAYYAAKQAVSAEQREAEAIAALGKEENQAVHEACVKAVERELG